LINAKNRERNKRLYKNNPIKLREQRKKDEARSRKLLTDKYIKKQLKGKGLPIALITNEIIDAQRQIIKIKRYVKEKTGKKHSRA
jgi:hypothetical protein